MKRNRIAGDTAVANRKEVLDWVFSMAIALIFLTSSFGMGYIVDSFEIMRLWKLIIWGVLNTVLVICMTYVSYLFDTNVRRHSR